MEKIKKTFIEKKYTYSFFGKLITTEEIEEVASRDPKLVENDGQMQGFRFFDQVYLSDEEESHELEKENFSNWFYYGERLTFKELKSKYKHIKNIDDLLYGLEADGYDTICCTQTGDFFPMEEEDMTYDEYISENKIVHTKTAQEMFDSLRKNIGKRAVCLIKIGDSLYEEKGTLVKVIDYERVVLDNYSNTFINSVAGSAIYTICLEDGTVLYENPYIKNLCVVDNSDELRAIKKIMFGYNTDDLIAISKLKQKFSPYDCLRKCRVESLFSTDAELLDEWTRFLKDNTKNWESGYMSMATCSMMRKISLGNPFEESLNEVYKEYPYLNEKQIKEMAEAIGTFSIRHEEFKEFWNNKYGNTRGIIKPKVFTKSKK